VHHLCTVTVSTCHRIRQKNVVTALVVLACKKSASYSQISSLQQMAFDCGLKKREREKEREQMEEEHQGEHPLKQKHQPTVMKMVFPAVRCDMM